MNWKILTTQAYKISEIPQAKEEDILFNTPSICRYPQRLHIGGRTKLAKKKVYFRLILTQLYVKPQN